MPRWLTALIVVLVLLWLVAPVQTEDMIKGAVSAVADRINSNADR